MRSTARASARPIRKRSSSPSLAPAATRIRSAPARASLGRLPRWSAPTATGSRCASPRRSPTGAISTPSATPPTTTPTRFITGSPAATWWWCPSRSMPTARIGSRCRPVTRSSRATASRSRSSHSWRSSRWRPRNERGSPIAGRGKPPRIAKNRQESSRIVKPTCLPLQHTGANARAMNAAIENIRNFAIIAHIDHGKSTLADRLIQSTGGLAEREMVEQVLDSMDIERERGITIKAQTVRLNYRARDGRDYVLNLIDTPGHVDFAYEVNRSLAACEGSLLVVDASQGVEAQTLANVYQAIDNGHEIVPVLNKVDLPASEPEKVKQQIEDVIGLDASNAILISAKTGQNVPEVLEAIVHRLPPPKGDREAPLKALLVDSWYDTYLGVVVLVRVVDGTLRKHQRIRMMRTHAVYEVERVGVFTPKLKEAEELGPGEIGFINASIKEVADTRVGDTITDDRKPTAAPLPGFRPAQPVVFCGLFPIEASDFEALRAAIAKLRLNDASFT